MSSEEITTLAPSAEPSRSERWLPRGEFLRIATFFQGGLLVVAVGLAGLAGIDLLGQLQFTTTAVLWGVSATLPMLLLFAVTHRFPVGPFRGVKDFLSDTLGPTLCECHWLDLAFLSLLAGVSEEMFFRGVVQTWLTATCGAVAALIVSNVLFGLAHSVSVFYVVLAGLLGVYFSMVFTITGEANLVPPILCHALYDFIALSIYRVEAMSARQDASAE